MAEPLDFDPATVEFKISPHFDLKPVEDGDWDIERRHSLADNIKHRAIYQRYREGMRWEDTDLFRDIYARRFLGGGRVRGEKSLDALTRQYYTRVDNLFDDMKRRGFCLTAARGRPYPLPNLLIGRGGEIYLGNNGNHRFAMARVLGIARIAGVIICRHSQA